MKISIMKQGICILTFFIFSLVSFAQEHPNQNAVSGSWIRENVINNPVTMDWLEKNLKDESPRLYLTDEVEDRLKSMIEDSELGGAYFRMLKEEADRICEEPLLEREKVGRRLLGVSREAVKRIGTLALVYRIGRDDKYLDRLANEIDAVSNFSDWNPSHFLDVAEMSYAISIGLDWCGEWLPESTVNNARAALKKHLLISLNGEDYNWWINAGHNWNQVCHAGMSAAALVMADEYPEIATKVISRAVDKLPLALASYSPDGAYPEGPTYWDYGTSYNLVALSIYESALGTSFNLAQVPGFMESAIYRMVVVAPSGKSFNYSDAGYGDLDFDTRGNLAWFAQKTGNGLFLNKNEFIDQVNQKINNNESPSRLAPANLIWMAQFEEENSTDLPVYWKGEGFNPIAIFRSEENENSGYYLGVKGGAASVNHGNMDVGSFIFELNGVRWSVDPGNQSYNELEQTIGSENLWDESQNSMRWSLLTKGNRFHSTLTVNGARHNVEGFAPIQNFETGSNPETVTLDLNEVFFGQLYSATRTFKKTGEQALRIEDVIKPGPNTKNVTWTMMTQAEVATDGNGAILSQDGHELELRIVEPANLKVSVISMDPPPLPYDKDIDNLKKIAIKIPGYILDDREEKIIVDLQAK